MANSVDLDEVAHYEPPHQDLHHLQIQLLLSLLLKDLNADLRVILNILSTGTDRSSETE